MGNSFLVVEIMSLGFCTETADRISSTLVTNKYNCVITFDSEYTFCSKLSRQSLSIRIKMSDWETVTFLRKKPQKSALKSEQVRNKILLLINKNTL